MDLFLHYLDTIKNCVDLVKQKKVKSNLHLIIGNEACDLDSMVSSISLGYYYFCTEPNGPTPLPLFNIPHKDIQLRTEAQYLFEKTGINLNNLAYRNSFDLEDVVSDNTVVISLVDQHVLRKKDEFLVPYVVEIYDHRPLEPTANWDPSKVKISIQEVGSCTTLIAELFLKNTVAIGNALAYLMYASIVYVTFALNPEIGKAKSLDASIVRRLAEKYNMYANYKDVFKTLYRTNKTILKLTPKDLLEKEFKFVEGVAVLTVPMTMVMFLKLPNAFQSMHIFCKEHYSATIVILGIYVSDEGKVTRDIGVFFRKDSALANEIIFNLHRAQELNGYDLGLQEVQLNVVNLRIFKQKNIMLTRDYIMSIVKDAVLIKKN